MDSFPWAAYYFYQCATLFHKAACMIKMFYKLPGNDLVIAIVFASRYDAVYNVYKASLPKFDSLIPI